MKIKYEYEIGDKIRYQIDNEWIAGTITYTTGSSANSYVSIDNCVIRRIEQIKPYQTPKKTKVFE